MTAVIPAASPSLPTPPRRRIRSLGPAIAAWIEANCVHTKGRWIGRPFALLPWQRELLNEMFEVERAPTGEWVRVYREAYIEVPKKNGKTELIAALALYFICEDPEPAPEVYCAANSAEQAELVFGAAKVMCETSPSLKKRTDPYRDEILVKDRPGAKLVRVAATKGTNDGLNVYIAIFDELHEFTDTKGRGVYGVLTNGQAGREYPMTISITTAGFDLDTLCGEKHQFAEKMLSGEIQDARFYAKIYAAPRSDPRAGAHDPTAHEWWRDPLAWELANPSYGHTVLRSFYEDKLRLNISPSEFQRYFLGWWVDAEDPWLPEGAWTACNAGAFELDPEAETWLGVDVGAFQDSTAVTCIQWNPENGKLRAQTRVWERPRDADGKPQPGWVLPIAEVENHIRERYQQLNVVAIGFDRRFMIGSAPQLEAEGLPMVEVPQSNVRMVPAFATWHELITQGRFEHDGDPAFARHVAAGVKHVISGGDGGWRLTKGKSKRKIDACYATAIAIAVMGDEVEREEPSIYETRGLITV